MLRSEFLGTLRIELGQSLELGNTPSGWGRVDIFSHGSFLGPKIRASLVNGSDRIVRRADGAMYPSVRLTLKTEDGAYLDMRYEGVRHGPAETMERIARGEIVRSDEYYLRSVLFFHTGDTRYDWLNRIVSVGIGRREPDAAVYDIHEIL